MFHILSFFFLFLLRSTVPGEGRESIQCCLNDMKTTVSAVKCELQQVP